MRGIFLQLNALINEQPAMRLASAAYTVESGKRIHLNEEVFAHVKSLTIDEAM